MPIAPCQALATEFRAWVEFPATCECLAECHALNRRVVYNDACVNASGRWLQPAQDGRWAAFKNLWEARPWQDPFGDGRWLRQAYMPGKRDPPQTAEQVLDRNLKLAASLQSDGEASKRDHLCSGRGLFTHVMPWWGGPSRGGLSKLCHCFPGWYGENCEYGPGHPQAPVVKQHCVHDCSKRGICKLNWCHCVPGTWGIDCGFGEPDAAAADAAELEQRRLELGAPYGWSKAHYSMPKPTLPAPSKHLRIYVYSLPPVFTVWLAAHFRISGR